MKTIGYLIEKEFKQLMRNSFMPRLIILFPIMLLVVFPWAATLEVENLQLAIIDNDHSQTSLRLLHQVEASDYFRLTQTCTSYEEALALMEKGGADLILEIPKDFEKDRLLGRPAEVLIAANAVNGTKGGLGSSYLAQIINEISSQSSIRYLYNPNLDYKHYMIPALMTMMLVMICGFLPALNIVGEKESGTIEQINVTPVSKITFTLAKLLPYWLIGFFVLSVAMLLAWLIYGLVPAGSLGTSGYFHSRCLRYRAGHLQLFRHNAAGNACNVVLYHGHDSDERAIDSDKQYARLGATDRGIQSVEILRGVYPDGVSERKPSRGCNKPFKRSVMLRPCV